MPSIGPRSSSPGLTIRTSRDGWASLPADILAQVDGAVDRWLLAHLNQIPHRALEVRRVRASPGAAP